MAQKQDPHPRRKGSVVWATVLSWLSSLLLALLALCLVLALTLPVFAEITCADPAQRSGHGNG